MFHRLPWAWAGLVCLVGAGSVAPLPVRGAPDDREIVRISIDDVPPELRHRMDPCAIDREADGRYAVFFLDASEAARLTVPHQRLGSLAEHHRRFLPAKTLQRKSIPSLQHLQGLPVRRSTAETAGGSAGTRAARGALTTLQYDEYHTLQEGVEFMLTLAGAFPDIVEMSSIGTSVEGREIWALKITDNPGVQELEEERILFTGVTHAREWATHEMMLYLAERLTNGYAAEPFIRHIVDHSVIWLVPVVNPDGFEYSWTNQRMWRKNRRPNPNGSFGVDINRNYAYSWGGPGSSSNPSNDLYRGPSPASEPETQAIQTFLADQKPAIAVGYHTYSQLVLYAWGSTAEVTPESYTSLRAIGRRYADLVAQVHGEQYLPGQSSYTIYVTSGSFDDHAYGAEGTLGFTPELRPASVQLGGFLLPEEQILPNNEENIAAALWMMWNVADVVEMGNPNGSTLIENPTLGDNHFCLALTPSNQKPAAALGFDETYQAQLKTWLDDAGHSPPDWGTLTVDYEGCGSGSGYVLDNTPDTSAWVDSLTSYRALPYIYGDSAEVMLSNVAPGTNLIGIPSGVAVPMQDISVVKRVMEPSGNTWGYGELILEERTALEDLNDPSPWIDWSWLYVDSAGASQYAHPTGAGGADQEVQPFRAYYVNVNVPSWEFGSQTAPVYLLSFPGNGSDCNGNGVLDFDEIIHDTSIDCNANAVLDACEYPGCPGLTPGDLNCDGVVDGGDLQGFVDRLVGGGYLCQADIDQDGSVGLGDIPFFVSLILGT